MILRRMVFAFLLLLCMNAAPFAYAAELLSNFIPTSASRKNTTTI